MVSESASLLSLKCFLTLLSSFLLANPELLEFWRPICKLYMEEHSEMSMTGFVRSDHSPLMTAWHAETFSFYMHLFHPERFGK